MSVEYDDFFEEEWSVDGIMEGEAMTVKKGGNSVSFFLGNMASMLYVDPKKKNEDIARLARNDNN